MDALITQATTADERDRAARIAVLPVGSFEQHGDHLPLTTDTVIAAAIARRIADDHNLFLLPPITVSCSHEHAPMAGTVSISAATLYALVNDIWRSLQASGIHGLIIVNGHGGNYVLSNVVQEANTTGPRVTLFPTREDWQRAREEADLETDPHGDMHGGEIEVSILLHVAPELVRDGIADTDHSAPDRSFLLTLGMAAYTSNGVIGQPSLAEASKGKAVLDSLTQSVVRHLRLIQPEC